MKLFAKPHRWLPLLLLPFIMRPWLFDDPVFAVRARAMADHPLRPYDYALDLDQFTQPAWPKGGLPADTNSPLGSWALALPFHLFDGGEAALHLFMALVALLCLLALEVPAEALTGNAGETLLFFALSPAFFLTAMTLYAHFFYLLFYGAVLTCVFRGARDGRLRWGLAFGGALMMAALALHQWPMALLDALIVYFFIGKSDVVKNRNLAWGLPLFAGLYGAWCLWETKVYGMPHIWGAFRLRAVAGGGYPWAASFIPLTFLAGAMPAVSVAWVLLFRKSRRAFAGMAAVVPLLWIFFRSALGGFDGLPAAELAVFLSTGLAFLCALPLLWPSDKMLVVLFLAEFLFVQKFLTMTAGHHLLSSGFLAAALSVRMADAAGLGKSARRWGAGALAVLTLSLAWCDTREALVSRAVVKDFPRASNGGVYYYWGDSFSGIAYYLKAAGWTPYDRQVPLKKGDRLLVYRNLNPQPPPAFLGDGTFSLEKDFSYPGGPGLRTLSVVDEAGWYSASWGTLPYGFSRRPFEEFELLKKERER